VDKELAIVGDDGHRGVESCLPELRIYGEQFTL